MDTKILNIFWSFFHDSYFHAFLKIQFFPGVFLTLMIGEFLSLSSALCGGQSWMELGWGLSEKWWRGKGVWCL